MPLYYLRENCSHRLVIKAIDSDRVKVPQEAGRNEVSTSS